MLEYNLYLYNMKNVIYKIESRVCNKIYIGSARNIYKRKSLHLRLLRQNKHHNIILQNHFNKYGENDLHFVIIEKDIDVFNLIEKEQFYIDSLNPKFNICKIAGSRQGQKQSKETKNKIRNSLIGKKHSEERVQNMKNAIRIPKNPMTEEHKNNISLGTKGCKKPLKTEKQISEASKRMLGNSLAKGKQYRNTSILQFEKDVLIAEYNSIKEAAVKYETTQCNICHCLNGRTKQHKGYEWKYKKGFKVKP